MKQWSEITGKVYEPDNMVFISNPVQIARYIKNGAILYDLKINDDKLVGVFSRAETAELYVRWQKHEFTN